MSATIDSKSTQPFYNQHENCSQRFHFICEAKQSDLHHIAEQENKILPPVYNRHKYGHGGSPEMELSNLALEPQKRSHDADDEESELSQLTSDQVKKSHDIVDEEHARQKRALGQSYNGDDGQILLDDVQSFQTNIDTFLAGMPSHTNSEYNNFRSFYLSIQKQQSGDLSFYVIGYKF